jgi:hypothetical protein
VAHAYDEHCCVEGLFVGPSTPPLLWRTWPCLQH